MADDGVSGRFLPSLKRKLKTAGFVPAVSPIDRLAPLVRTYWRDRWLVDPDYSFETLSGKIMLAFSGPAASESSNGDSQQKYLIIDHLLVHARGYAIAAEQLLALKEFTCAMPVRDFDLYYEFTQKLHFGRSVYDSQRSVFAPISGHGLMVKPAFGEAALIDALATYARGLREKIDPKR